MNHKNKIAWIMFSSIWVLFLWITFYGPETHSEIHEAPTTYSKIRDIIIFFFLVGSVVLPVKNISSLKVNYTIIVIGFVTWLIKVSNLVLNLIKNEPTGERSFFLFAIIGSFSVLIALNLKLRVGYRLLNDKTILKADGDQIR